MIEPHNTTELSRSAGFPFTTATLALTVVFLFLGITLYVYRSPNPLGEPRHAADTDPIVKLNAVRARDQAVLDGEAPFVKMSVEQSTIEILERIAKSKDDKSPNGRLPFPTEPKAP